MPPTSPVVLTVDVLRRVCPYTQPSVLAQRLGPLQRTLELAEANTPMRAAALVAQLAFESAWFRAWVEAPSRVSGQAFEAYDPPNKVARILGNTVAGDGARYKGRGFIQLTGRSNYAAAGRALGLDLASQPDLAATADVAPRVAAWYWRSKGLNELADAGDLLTITKRINGGTNGYTERLGAYQRAREALGIP
jgi:putative chitinase